MAFVERNQRGEIVSVLTWPNENAQEFLPDDHPDVIAGPVKPPELAKAKQLEALGVNDSSMIEALWEKVIEGRDGKALALQAKRAQV